MELRHLRYFVAVAEELHFGRAAERLYMAAPPLSQRIKELERELGTQLFVRSTRSVQLTDAGRRLLPTARSIVRSAEDAARTVGEQPCAGLLRVGIFGHGLAELTGPVLQAFRERCADVRVELLSIAYGEQVEALTSGRADVMLSFGPLDDERVEFVELSSEPRIVIVPDTDPLADAAAVTVDDLVDRAFLRSFVTPECRAWGEYWLLGDVRPTEEAHTVGADCRSIEEAQIRIASGEGIGTAPASVGRFYRFPGLAHIVVEDAAPSRTGLFLAGGEARELPLRFADVARDVATAAVH